MHSAFELVLAPRPPFRLDLTVWTLRRRSDNIVDRWDGRVYRRVLSLAGETVAVAVTRAGSLKAPRLRVSVEGRTLGSGVETAVRMSLERLLGLDQDLRGFYGVAAQDEPLK